MEDGVNGQFFNEQTVDSLAEAVAKFNEAKFDRSKIAKTAERFKPSIFDKAFDDLINKNYETPSGD